MKLLSLCILAISLVVSFSFGVQQRTFVEQSPFAALSSPTCLNAAPTKGPGNIQRPQNEFSRTYRTESVLGSRQRAYEISIQATQDERTALAVRFELPNIGKLEAELSMRREPSVKGGDNRVTGVEVEGTVSAVVTQTCVRTNEDFDLELEIPLFAVVRPVASLFDDAPEEDDLAELESFFKEEARSKKKGRDNKAVSTPQRNVNEMDMAELQRMLQEFDLEDDVFEDESIYSLDGVIDIGELVAQFFWLKLDPYPKKPGTYPIRTSITG